MIGLSMMLPGVSAETSRSNCVDAKVTLSAEPNVIRRTVVLAPAVIAYFNLTLIMSVAESRNSAGTPASARTSRDVPGA